MPFLYRLVASSGGSPLVASGADAVHHGVGGLDVTGHWFGFFSSSLEFSFFLVCFPFKFFPSSCFSCCHLGSLYCSPCLLFLMCLLLLVSLVLSPLLFLNSLLWLLPFHFLSLLSPQLHLRLLLLVFLWLLRFVLWLLPLVFATS